MRLLPVVVAGAFLGAAPLRAAVIPTTNYLCKASQFGLTPANNCTGQSTITALPESGGIAGFRISTTGPITLEQSLGGDAELFLSGSNQGSALLELPANGSQIPLLFDFMIQTTGNLQISRAQTGIDVTGLQGNNVVGSARLQLPATAGSNSISANATWVDRPQRGAGPGLIFWTINVSLAFTGTGTITVNAPQSFVVGTVPAAVVIPPVPVVPPPTGAIPEPSSVALVGAGLAGIAIAARKKIT